MQYICSTLMAGVLALGTGSQYDPTLPHSSPATPTAVGTDISDPTTATPESTMDPAALSPDQIIIDRDRYERMTVPVTIQGHGPYRFLVDTGAQATVVTHRVVESLKLLPTGQAMLVAMGSAQMVDTIDIDDMEFANRSFSGITAPLLNAKNVGADGIIGLDSLQRLKVIIDFVEDRISVSDAPLPRAMPSSHEIIVQARRKFGQMIITDARVNGIRTAVIIDTGSQHSLGNQALRDKLRSKDKDDIMLESVDVNGITVASNVAMVREIKVGGMIMRGVPLGFHDSPAFAVLGLTKQPAIILGMQNLRSLNRVAIDFANRRVLFDLPRDVGENPVERVFNASRIKSS
ncbi:MAG: aspartyl protease family protein [Sphingomonadaceae bacterium]